MKRFISTKLFYSLQEPSQTGIDMDAQLLKNEYDEFVAFLFSESAAFTDKSAYHDALVLYPYRTQKSYKGIGKKIPQFIFAKLLQL